MAYSALPTRTNSDANSAADVNQLQTNISHIAPKTYNHGTTYNSVLLEVTSAASGFTVGSAHFIPYQTIDGAWWLRGQITATQTGETTMTISISGVTFKEYSAGLVFNGMCYCVDTNGNIDITYNASYTNCWISFDARLDSKPTWAD